MKEKLELKHVAPYLPYKVKCQVYDRGVLMISTLDACFSDNSYSFMNIIESEKGFDEIKLVLRPLSDITKEIEVNGEKFVPLNKMTPYSTSRLDSDGCFDNVNDMPFIDVVKLLEWHFDVFGLIDLGLAIYINTL